MRSTLGQFQKGDNGWNGRKHSVETIKKLKKIHTGQKGYWAGKKRPTGELSANWKGGRTFNDRNRERREKEAGRARPDSCEACATPTKDLKKALAFDHNHQTGVLEDGFVCGVI